MAPDCEQMPLVDSTALPAKNTFLSVIEKDMNVENSIERFKRQRNWKYEQIASPPRSIS